MSWLSFVLLCYKSSFILSQSPPLLLLISFDGFRFDYPQLYGPLQHFSRLEERGVHAHSMIPTFTTATFPNHYTLITGLYEEVHGLVSDQIYDSKTNSTFQTSGNMTSQWWPFKTIWTINEQRPEGRSGVIGWPQNQIFVSKYEPYRKERTFQDVTDQMLNWFNDPKEPINFGAIYFPEPELTGRQTGPYSNKMNDTIKLCDNNLGYLLNEIDRNSYLKKNLHLIITSDHGMEQINGTDRPIYLEDYVDMNKLKAFGTETVLNIFLNSTNDVNDVYRNLSQIPHTTIYRQQDIPARYHYTNNSRIGNLIIMVDPGYELHRRSFHGGIRVNLSAIHGNHGYDNQMNSMKTIFYASGRQLRDNFTLSNTATLHNVDIFALMCLILNITKCPPSNGSLANIQPFLKDPTRVLGIIEKDPGKSQDGSMSLVIYLLVLVSFVLILIMAVVWSGVSFRNASAISRATHLDPLTIAEQNQYKFTQINDMKLNRTIGDDNL
ncbi:unnamed protein product [Rotaria socialis]|uniref:Uncharacterized protein n=1 Tax=Rotaria socialis TaxID=392032 RepID=A0A820IHZ4_9BILA|nr:unnamed protein product [Rotaria socialis]CAF3439873.1 unnamed protein product [Rotaria socialis]CAF3452375.1 unnamed protein product [Rotaria socialis]CAF3547282.1 unnamed protein product [Rotaria socialis]CAF3752533.1 unnamed protein product [Rotaria socialis]